MKRLIKANSMKIIYSDQQLPNEVVKTIFLAGPSPRDKETVSWRIEAVELLKNMNYNGTVFVPEPSSGVYMNYEHQIDWELSAMKRADIILFWIPRELQKMPGFTTNVEFGAWIDSGKVVVGFPKEAEKVRYLEELAKKNNVICYSTLEETLKEAVDKVRNGALRTEGEVEVPLFVWNTKSFQNWYNAQKEAGNRLDHADLKFTYRVGPNKDIVFLWILHVDVFVSSEDRNKSIEFVMSRTDSSSTLLYKKEESLMDTKIILIREFRSPASTPDGFIWELAGGSSKDESEDVLEVAASEIEEETGFKINKDRIRYIQQRQSSGTLLANKISLFAAEINEEELKWFEDQKGVVHGVVEDTERTFIEVLTLREILSNELVDWSNVGMIMKALTEEGNTNE